jgi:uncharacterized protein YjbI with pentapeptide repeats
LGDANLKKVDFANSILDKVEFDNADLTKANFNNATLSGGKFNRTMFAATEFNDAALAGIYVLNSSLLNVEFKKSASISKDTEVHKKGDLSNSVWKDCVFESCSFFGVQFLSAGMENIVLKSQVFRNVKICKSRISNVDFTGSSFMAIDFFGSEFQPSRFKNTDLYDINFENTILAGVDFSNSTMNKVSFKNAVVHFEKRTSEEQPLPDANFTGVKLIADVDMSDANITDSQLMQIADRKGLIDTAISKRNKGSLIKNVANKLENIYKKRKI